MKPDVLLIAASKFSNPRRAEMPFQGHSSFGFGPPIARSRQCFRPCKRRLGYERAISAALGNRSIANPSPPLDKAGV